MEGVIQVDACPFHSSSLPHKAALFDAITTGAEDLLKRYIEALREFLDSKRVIAISAVSSLTSLGLEVPHSPWARWLSEIAGLDLKVADFVPLVKKGEKVTVGAFVSGQDERCVCRRLGQGPYRFGNPDLLRRFVERARAGSYSKSGGGADLC